MRRDCLERELFVAAANDEDLVVQVDGRDVAVIVPIHRWEAMKRRIRERSDELQRGAYRRGVAAGQRSAMLAGDAFKHSSRRPT